ncbi:FAD/NAD(P)-binding domain-containing protein [Pseudovirgaria hyperparasitica]|uniref:FAD/NAD(P)-binding domain-containing protein n=1 Tax=Pseudovirgaria hyperparasitica TaxID=470096 RepID=A0A6A6W9Z2_9PEZI|nr:FAD/NAD(P)-binding domain-containing protein [Pseudovirgaria hyperparasitica]KAF2758770.1 FAD/NAD(P)-binding domain-containing protein [Pseudovirgaria hyperparasitica]
MTEPLRIAIVGGSIAGCTLANGLLKYKHITFDVFESKDSFRERGAAIAMHTNALAALRCMGMEPDRILKDGHGNKRDSLRTIAGVGDHKGEHFLETIDGPWGIGRQQLLEELVKPLPKQRLHCNKKLVSITENDTGPLVLHFADGSIHVADAVLGCDGYRSRVREIILGKDHAAAEPVFAGFWDARGLIPTEQAVKQFGTNIIDPRDSALSAVVGNNCFTLSGQIDSGKMYFITVSGSAPKDWDETAWKTELKREHLERTYAGWDEQFRTGVIDCIMTSGPGVVFNQWESQPAPTYFRNRICMLGDAAHATSNWLGQGAAMAIEDCMVLSKLFELVKHKEDLIIVFKAFDRTRRAARPDMIIEQSRLLGQILTGQKGLDPAAVQQYDMQRRRLEILNYDVTIEIRKALESFHHFKSNS